MSGAYSMDDLPDIPNNDKKCVSCGVKMYFGHEHTPSLSAKKCEDCGADLPKTKNYWCVKCEHKRTKREIEQAQPPIPGDDLPSVEQCICAAIKTKDGQIIIGHRHADAIKAATDRKLELLRESGGQGFITSKNRYVDRKEAMLIQKSAGIQSASEAGYLGDELYSEDLY